MCTSAKRRISSPLARLLAIFSHYIFSVFLLECLPQFTLVGDVVDMYEPLELNGAKSVIRWNL